MNVPRGVSSAEYCACPTAASTRRCRDSLNGRQRVLAGDFNLAHVADVEQAGAGPDRHVLVGDARVLDRHVPAAERHHLRARGAMPGVERRFLQGSVDGGSMTERTERVKRYYAHRYRSRNDLPRAFDP